MVNTKAKGGRKELRMRKITNYAQPSLEIGLRLYVCVIMLYNYIRAKIHCGKVSR